MVLSAIYHGKRFWQLPALESFEKLWHDEYDGMRLTVTWEESEWMTDGWLIGYPYHFYTVSVDLTGRVPSKAKKGLSVTFNVRENFLD